MSRTTRTERSASWKTSAGAVVSCDALLEHLVELVQVLAARARSPRAWRRGRRCARSRRRRRARGRASRGAAARARVSSRRRETPTPSPVGRVDHVAPGDRQLHRQARALRLQRVLDDLHDDLLAGLEQVGDLAPAAAAPAPGRLDAGQHDLVDVQEAVLLEADVDERRLEPGQHVVDLALVDVADDRARAAALEVELSDAVAGVRACLARWRARPRAAAASRRRAFRWPPEARRASRRGRR